MLQKPIEFTDEEREKISTIYEKLTSESSVSPLMLIPIICMIDVDTWRFPDSVRSIVPKDVIVLIEDYDDLRELFQSQKRKQLS